MRRLRYGARICDGHIVASYPVRGVHRHLIEDITKSCGGQLAALQSIACCIQRRRVTAVMPKKRGAPSCGPKLLRLQPTLIIKPARCAVWPKCRQLIPCDDGSGATNDLVSSLRKDRRREIDAGTSALGRC